MEFPRIFMSIAFNISRVLTSLFATARAMIPIRKLSSESNLVANNKKQVTRKNLMACFLIVYDFKEPL
jgi:hypothetical protein